VSDLDCNELVELVTAFTEGALDPVEERRVVDHLAMCDGCSAYVAQVRATVAHLGELAPGPLDEETRRRLLAAFREDPAHPV
jgi:anti-sigma factor RsiW